MVKALEAIVQAYMVQGNAMAGLQAANKELADVKASGNLRGEVDLLEMIAQTHSELAQPRSALSFAKQALDIYSALGDNMGQGNMYHLMAEMQRSLGEMSEASAS